MQYDHLKQPPEAQTMAKDLPAHQLLAGHPSARRDYHSHWCNCFGDCDGPSWAACCLSFFLPCVATGWNLQRASGKADIGWATGLLLLAAFVAFGAIAYAKVECSYGPENCKEDPYVSCSSFTCSVEGWPAVVLVVLVLVALGTGVASRHCIRKMLSLDSLNDEPVGVFCGDFWSHFFIFCNLSCGLCQETRTMMINNVEKGVWNGPSTMVVPAVAMCHQVPQASGYHVNIPRV